MGRKSGLDILRDVDEDKYFWVNNGPAISNIAGLSDVLKVMSDETFKHHVTDDRNDFYNWIRYVVDDEVLARDIQKINTQTEMSDAIARRIAEIKSGSTQKIKEMIHPKAKKKSNPHKLITRPVKSHKQKIHNQKLHKQKRYIVPNQKTHIRSEQSAISSTDADNRLFTGNETIIAVSALVIVVGFLNLGTSVTGAVVGAGELLWGGLLISGALIALSLAIRKELRK
ncbi:MAG: hypothetical protein ABIJ08_00130 [Nanoarchaeota archaeon]